MAKTKTSPWNVVDHLKSDEDMAAYLEAVGKEGDPALVSAAEADVALARERLAARLEAGRYRGE